MKKSTKDKSDKLFSTADNIIMIITIVLCLGLEISSVLPNVQDKIYEVKYNKLIEQGHTECYAKTEAQSQTQSAKTALYFGGVGAGLIGIGALRIKKAIESKHAFKRIENKYGHIK